MLILAGCSFSPGSRNDGTLPEETPLPPAPPVVFASAISYAPETITVQFTSDIPAIGTECALWRYTENDYFPLLVIETPPKDEPSTLLSWKIDSKDSLDGAYFWLSITAANPGDPTKTATTVVTFHVAHREFTREEHNGSWFAAYRDEHGIPAFYGGYGIAALKKHPGADTEYFYVNDRTLDDLFYTVYVPNSPGTKKTTGYGATVKPLPFDESISEKTLSLLEITVGATAADDVVTLKGIPAFDADESPAQPVVIDIGNAAYPEYVHAVINAGNFGNPDEPGDYSGVILRVNKGARLEITGEDGLFNNGTVEIAAGGTLLSHGGAAFFPGEDAVIMLRLSSMLYKDGRFLVSRPNMGSAVEWDSGDQLAGWIEIRKGSIAFSAFLTLKESLALSPDVWFSGGSRIFVDTKDAAESGAHGLYSPTGANKFYGTASVIGGHNIVTVTATAVVNNGAALHRAFFESGYEDAEDTANYITAQPGGRKEVVNTGSKGSGIRKPYIPENGIAGYPNWTWNEL